MKKGTIVITNQDERNLFQVNEKHLNNEFQAAGIKTENKDFRVPF